MGDFNIFSNNNNKDLGNRVSVTAYADLQKTLDDSPYLRFVQCHIDDGTIDARVGDMGLLTDTVNNKYKVRSVKFIKLKSKFGLHSIYGLSL